MADCHLPHAGSPGAPSFRHPLAEGGVVDLAIAVGLVFVVLVLSLFLLLFLQCHPERSEEPQHSSAWVVPHKVTCRVPHSNAAGCPILAVIARVG